ncbi:hypothetical protein KVV02_000402 [Mortierella alpina]|uniref:Uncharacterized protein n=1 Tax=Mortierella alpina TaxID=64518 RepID=A0A9P8I966_MORAP|nr:hypothetical protein KVV02_000402 [Mortierella alpina]
MLCPVFLFLAPRVLDREARARQLRNHLESLERDNFVVLNEYEAIIATAAAAASTPGPATLNAKPMDAFQDPSSVGAIVGSFVGTVGPSSSTAAPTGRLKNKKAQKAGTSGDDLIGGSTAPAWGQVGIQIDSSAVSVGGRASTAAASAECGTAICVVLKPMRRQDA